MLLKVAILFLLYIVLVWIIYPGVPDGKDYIFFFRPAIYQLITGNSPYNVSGFVSPPWTLLPLIPLTILPDKLASAILVVSCPIIFGGIAYKLGAKLLLVITIAFSSPVIHCAFNVNIDWLSALGILMPPQLGLLFALTKPQVGIGIAAYWFVESWNEGKIKKVMCVFGPVMLAYLLSFALYGFWPLKTIEMANVWWNTSLFPWSVPLGLGILFAAILKKQKTLSAASSPFLSPYLAMQSWSGLLVGLIPYPRFAILVSALIWVITLYYWLS